MTALLWIAEHWWIIAIALVLVLVALALSSATAAAQILKALAGIAAGIVGFFASPSQQRAGKILLAVFAFCIGAWLANLYTANQLRAEFEQEKAEAVAAAHQADTDAAKKADTLDKQEAAAAAVADKANADNRTGFVNELPKSCAVMPADAVRRLRNIQ